MRSLAALAALAPLLVAALSPTLASAGPAAVEDLSEAPRIQLDLAASPLEFQLHEIEARPPVSWLGRMAPLPVGFDRFSELDGTPDLFATPWHTSGTRSDPYSALPDPLLTLE